MKKNNVNLLSHSSRGWKSKINVLAELVLLRAVSENLHHASYLPSDDLMAVFGIISL